MDERAEEHSAPLDDPSIDRHRTPAPANTTSPSIQSLKDFVVQLLTITAGVLIALSLEGLLEWNNHRLLVREAKAIIAREIADNKTELDRYLTGTEQRLTDVATSLKLANDLLTTRKSDVGEIKLQLDLSSLSAAGWHTAERTNALAYMDYTDVQEYAKLYDFQNLYVIYQRQMLDRGVSTLSKIVGSDAQTGARQLISPRTAIFAAQKAPPADLERFRQELQALSSELLVDDQLGKSLSERYKEMVGRR